MRLQSVILQVERIERNRLITLGIVVVAQRRSYQTFEHLNQSFNLDFGVTRARFRYPIVCRSTVCDSILLRQSHAFDHALGAEI